MIEVAEINKPAWQPLGIQQGTTINDLTIGCTVKATGEPVNWTGYEFTCQVRKSASKSSPVLATINIVGNAEGILTLNCSEIKSVPSGEYKYDIHAKNGSVERYIFEGPFTIHPSVTIPTSS